LSNTNPTEIPQEKERLSNTNPTEIPQEK